MSAGRAVATAWAAWMLAVPAGGSAQETVRLEGERVAIYDLAGRVEIVRGGGPEVTVHVRRGGKDGARLTLETGRIDGRETLRVRFPGDEIVYPALGRGSTTNLTVRDDGTFGGRWGGDRVRIRGSGSGVEAWADLVVEVPDGLDLQVHVGAGEIEAAGVDAAVTFDTGAGAVRVTDVTGPVRVDTGSGIVELTRVLGEVRVDTGSGRITGRDLVGGDVGLDTGSGAIEITGVTADDFRADTGSGAITLRGVRARAVDVDSGSGSVDVELLAGLDELVVDTGSGSVRLSVPGDFGAELVIESGSGGIEVDLPVEVEAVRRDSFRGRLGDGRARVAIETGSGRVRVSRAP